MKRLLVICLTQTNYTAYFDECVHYDFSYTFCCILLAYLIILLLVKSSAAMSKLIYNSQFCENWLRIRYEQEIFVAGIYC